MMKVLSDDLGYANTILLVLEGSTPRFHDGLYAMIRQMTSIYLWRIVVGLHDDWSKVMFI